MVENMTQLTAQQSTVAAQRGKLFLEGAAGTGKTTAAVQHLLNLLESGASASEILVLVPQRTLAAPYRHALRTGDFPAGGEVTVTTLAGIAIQMIDLFWPVVASKSGFKPETPPTFLSTETAQFIMQQVVRELVETQGYFDGVTIERSRLYIQLLDNLNKAAVVGFPVTEIGQRLADAWLGDPAQNLTFTQVQECTNRFRTFCVEHNLLDFSLQMEIFTRHLWRLPACRDLLLGQYKHLIADNVDEDNPATQDMLREWLPRFETALVIYDTEAGYRRFLGADPDNGYTLRQSCKQTIEFSESFVSSPDVDALGNALARALDQYAEDVPGDALAALQYSVSRFYPDMITRVTDEVRRLVEQEGVSPGEIAILAPFLPDSLRFSLMQRLNGIPTRAHRPSRVLRENPASHCLLTLAQLAHPAWGMKPDTFDVAYALMRAIGTLEPNQSLDLVRAQLLAQSGYPDEHSKSGLAPFDNLPLETQERVSHVLGERYDALREWLEDYVTRTEAPPPPPAEPEPKRKGRKKKVEVEAAPVTPEPELDYFFSLLFGEVLSQRGFGFHNDSAAADIAWDLTDSARNFRRAIDGKGITTKPIAQAYVELVQGGIVANQYLREWQYPAPNSVFIAPANTFLLNNQPVSYQFWLDIGSRMWFERFFQPLTHPYVLSKQWTPGEKWTDEREMEMRRESLYQLVLGLVRRCRVGVYLGISELGENGYENGGELLQVFSRMLRRLTAEAEGRDDV